MRLRFELFILTLAALAAMTAPLAAVADEEIIRTDIGAKRPPPTTPPKWSFSIMTSYRSTQGKFDPYGDYAPTPDGTSTNSIATIFSETYRFNDHWSQSVSLPLNNSAVITPTGNSNIYTLGAPGFDIRYNFGTPVHLHMSAGSAIPVRTHWGDKNGEPSASASMDNDLGAAGPRGPDIHTGMGVWAMYKKFKGTFQTAVSFPFTQTVTQSDIPDGPTMQVKRGLTYSLGEGLSFIANDKWNLNLGQKQSWAMQSTVDGQVSEGTAARLFLSTAGVSYGLNKMWRVSAGYETPWPWFDYVVNQSYAPTVMAGVSYAGL